MGSFELSTIFYGSTAFSVMRREVVSYKQTYLIFLMIPMEAEFHMCQA
jgi:hypothetical protein